MGLGYWILIGGIALVSMIVSGKLKSKFNHYSKVHLRNGMSGAEIAEKMLADHGIRLQECCRITIIRKTKRSILVKAFIPNEMLLQQLWQRMNVAMQYNMHKPMTG